MKIEVKPLLVGFPIGYIIQVGVGALALMAGLSALTWQLIITFIAYFVATFTAAYLAKQQLFYHAALTGTILVLSGIPTEGFNLAFIIFELIFVLFVSRLSTAVVARLHSS